MLSRTRVPRWAPPIKDAIHLAWRPALAYFVFSALGSIVLFLNFLWYSRHSESGEVLAFALGVIAGMFGVLLGMLIAMLRLRALPVFVVSGIFVTIVTWMVAQANPPGGELIAIPILFFSFAFPCGLLALMHRYEIFASFWPAVGWIGSVFVVLNEENRVHVWEQEKIKAWLPMPLVYLASFLVLWLVYFAAKQAARVEMWQALSGAAARRIAKKEDKKNRVSALPRKNILAILVVAALLFGVTAALSPYLWRTGKGDKPGNHQVDEKPENEKDKPKPSPDFDGEELVKQLQKMAQAAKNTLPKLWPLLLLLLLYRPAKRALLLAHLKAPIVPTPPSERIDNAWEYVRIAAEDAGIVPTSADSIEDLVIRIHTEGKATPALAKAAEIYARTRYGFVVAPGDAIAMRASATEAAIGLREKLSVWERLRNQWRPLA
jgi:hypothetical protein